MPEAQSARNLANNVGIERGAPEVGAERFPGHFNSVTLHPICVNAQVLRYTAHAFCANHLRVNQENSLSAALKAAFSLARPRRTISEVAPRIGLTYDVLSNILNGRTRADSEIVERLRRELGKPKGWPYSDLAAVAREGEHGRIVSLAGTPLVSLPVIGRVSAGPGEANVDMPVDEVYVPESIAQMGGYGWEVAGDSMMPDLEPGDVLTFKECRRPRRGIMLLRSADREDRVKEVLWTADEWTLRSRNPAYPPEPLGTTELLGLWVGFYRRRGTREIALGDSEGLDLPLFAPT